MTDQQLSKRQSESFGQDSDACQAGTASDVASKVFSFAPYWKLAQIWHMKKDSAGNASISFSGPFHAEELLQLYRDRQLKGSNLIVGVDDDCKEEEVPATFMRTLAYLFELVGP